jgi:serine/threonine-protein kinase RsbW
MRIFEAERPASLAEVSWLRRAMARRLGDFRLPAEVVDDLQLVVSEIASNAVVHEDPAPKTISVRLDIQGTELILEVIDDGAPFVSRDLALREPMPQDPLSHSGRGLGLARDALDHTRYWSDGVNHFVGRRNLRRRRPSALVVEDTPTLLEMYREALRGDYRVIGCASFEEAKSALRDTSIDVVLADVHLGDGLGVALPEEIAKLDGRALPVVLVSSDNSIETREAALRQGAEFYLAKPVRPPQLRQAVAMAITRAAVRDARLASSFSRHVDRFVTALLPPQIGNYDVASAAGTPSAGGGDLVLHLPQDGSDRIVVIDVMGHGVGARAWAIAYAAIVRTLHLTSGFQPAVAFLTELARIAWSEPTLDEALATALVVDLDLEGATIASAGHPLPIVFGEEIRRCSAINPLLGILKPERFQSERMELSRGDRLALFTDGLDPSGVAAGDDPPEWFMSPLREGRGVSLVTAANRLREATETALGPQPADDWTFMLIEKRSS